MGKHTLNRLIQGAELHKERDAAYGQNFVEHGPLMQALFPNGINLETPEDHARFGVVTQIAAKLKRYCQNFETGGHGDSSLDGMVYFAMLDELDNGPEEGAAKTAEEIFSTRITRYDEMAGHATKDCSGGDE